MKDNTKHQLPKMLIPCETDPQTGSSNLAVIVKDLNISLSEFNR